MFIKTKRGFTLIELMIVVAIIGILAAIAIPKFSDLVTKSNEASSKGNLGAIRSALSIYYGDLEGWYPTDAPGATISSLTLGGKYMANVPPAKTPAKSGLNIGHNDATTVVNAQADAGGWYYENDTTDPDWGRIVVNCTHKDTKSNAWSSY